MRGDCSARSINVAITTAFLEVDLLIMERTGTLMMLITLEGVREGVHGTAAVLEPITRERTHGAKGELRAMDLIQHYVQGPEWA